MKRLRTAFVLAGAITLGGLAWQVVRPAHAPAAWVRAAAPRVAVAGGTLPLRLTFPAPAVGGVVCAGLHWSSSHHEPRGFLGGCPAQAVAAAGGVLDFQIPVPVRTDLRSVTAVVHVGPTGLWADRVRSAVTDEIPVRPAGDPGAGGLRPLGIHDQVADPEIRPAEVPLARWLAAGLWVVAAAVDRRRGTGLGPAAPSWWVRHGLALACLAAALVEAGRGELMAAGRLREIAQAAQLYFERRWVQQLATLGAVGGAAAGAWFALARVKPPGRSLAALALGGHAAFSLANMVSQHEVDRLFATGVGPLPLIQVLKLATAAVAVAGLLLPERR